MKKYISVIVTLLIFGCSSPQFNISKVNNDLYRGPRPSVTDLQILKDYGIKSVLDLEEYESDIIKREKESSEKLGLIFVHIPMSNFTRPTTLELTKAYKEISEGLPTPVYVHCLHGQDRTGFVIATYRMLKDNWTLEEAYNEAIKMGHKSWMYDSFPFYWKKSLKEIDLYKRIVIMQN